MAKKHYGTVEGQRLCLAADVRRMAEGGIPEPQSERRAYAACLQGVVGELAGTRLSAKQLDLIREAIYTAHQLGSAAYR